MDVLKYHEEILTYNSGFFIKVQDRGVKCKDALINVDRLEIIETLYSSFVQLWKKGECDYCFEIEPNGTTTYTPNNSTIHFHAIENSVRECIKKNMEKNSTVCTLCREPYKKLNDFYNSLKQSSRVCMDIVDSMNASRMEWSKDLGCKLHFEMDPYLITTAVLFTFIPSIFYGLVKKYSSRVESRLLYQEEKGSESGHIRVGRAEGVWERDKWKLPSHQEYLGIGAWSSAGYISSENRLAGQFYTHVSQDSR
ncbi:hypothetical protein J437_LFUL018074 [Ladona fulva]|uniref:Osteopetrosis-associated transmembrane protein 1 n=1 Tax=Ladona fulva TaxID=123851 RepID=A0A8K0KNW3_LADFU|nr:hypothetical protein J437_LFUL018074 [Ladona fulva]